MSEISHDDEGRAIAAAAADPREFVALYEAHFTRIFRYLLTRLRDADRAEELTQETFLRALRDIRRYRDRGAPYAAYLYRIAHNLLVNSFRERKHSELKETENLVSQSRDDHDAALIWNTVARFPTETQDVIALRFRDGLKIPEIARSINKSESATKMMLSRALAAIREQLL